MFRCSALILFLLFGCVVKAEGNYKYGLSICVLFQNEAPYLKEWIEYHRLLGVSHFYCYNHHSTDHYREILEPYLKEGIAQLKDIHTTVCDLKTYYAMQCKCYTDCLNEAKGETQWLAFIDPDEFLLPIQDVLLTDFLKNYEVFGGVCVNWLMFGTSSLKKIPADQLLIESLVQCSENLFACNRYVKSIVRPEWVSHFASAHQPTYLDGYWGVNTNKLPVTTDKSDYVLLNKLRINHYWTRDEDFFYKVKVPRQIQWGGAPDPQTIFQKMNAVKDETIMRYVPALKKRVYAS